jgi:excisionase family DNA binding protein
MGSRIMGASRKKPSSDARRRKPKTMPTKDTPEIPLPPPSGAILSPLLLRIPEAARLLSVSRSKLYDLIERGELPTVAIGKAGKTQRIPLVALQAWVAQRTAYRAAEGAEQETATD